MTHIELVSSARSQHIERIPKAQGNVLMTRDGYFVCRHCGARKQCPPNKYPFELPQWSAALREFKWEHEGCGAQNA